MAGNGRACPLCGYPAARDLALAHTIVWKCTALDCGLQYANPQLTEKDLARAYTELYYPGKENAREVRFENTPDDILRQVFSQLETRLGNLQGLRLLDYGCGRGPLLRVSLEFGLRPTGIESDPHARATAAKVTGAPIYDGVEELRDTEPGAQFDLIILWTAIEHLRRPWSDLRELRGLLRSGGWLLLSTMNTRCLRARIERERWENYENPTHFYYFDRKSLERVIHSAGFLRAREWKPEICYPHHGTMRRRVYEISTRFGVSDGLYYLCPLGADEAQTAIGLGGAEVHQ